MSTSTTFTYEPGTPVEGTYGKATFTGVVESYRWHTSRRNVMKITVTIEDAASLREHGFDYNAGDLLILDIDYETGYPADLFTNHSVYERGKPPTNRVVSVGIKGRSYLIEIGAPGELKNSDGTIWAESYKVIGKRGANGAITVHYSPEYRGRAVAVGIADLERLNWWDISAALAPIIPVCGEAVAK